MKTVVVPELVLKWLLGECPHPETGAWFERPEGRVGNFWWRTELRAAMEAPPASEPVAQAAAQDMAKSIHYPECWDTAAYPTLDYALMEVCGATGCSVHAPAAAPAVEVPPENVAMVEQWNLPPLMSLHQRELRRYIHADLEHYISQLEEALKDEQESRALLAKGRG